MRNRCTQEELQERIYHVDKRLKDGAKFYQIAYELDIDLNSVRRIAKLYCGFQPRSYKYNEEEVVEMLKKGFSVNQTAEHFGLTYHNVFRIKKKHNL